MRTGNWLLRRPTAKARLRLFCFPYAGGNAAAYLNWQPKLGPEIEICAIQLPGRGTRMGEPAIDRLAPLVRQLAEVIAGEGDLPAAFFGHSLGALVAFELARFSKLMHLRGPERLIVSGCQAPSVRQARDHLHTLPDAELIEELRRYNGTPAAILAHAELMALVLPAIRADFAIVETYAYRAGIRLDQPIDVLAGTKDPIVPPDRVAPWLAETERPGGIHWFEGDHFFLDTQPEAVAARLRDLLRPA